jgi:hypothetical protein
MNSKIPDDLLSAFLDRELTAAEEAIVNNHLKSSPQVRQELQDYQRVSELLQGLPRLALPSEFASTVMQRAERETLIPLDPVSPPRGPQWRRPSRQAWIVTAVAAVAASVAVLVVVSQPRRQNEMALASKTLDVKNPPGSKKVSHRLAIVSASAAAPSAPALVAARPAPPTGLLGMARASKKAPAERRETKAVASLMYGQSADGKGTELVLPADLKKAKVGDVIEAMEKVGNQVAVVRLTVLDQTASLGGIKSLLVREPVRASQGGRTPEAKERESLDKDTKEPLANHQQTAKSGAGELVCVFIEGSREELAGVLKDVQNERGIQEAELTNTISVEKLSQYANHAVAPATAASSTSHAKTVLSLPATTVSQILADNRHAPATRRERQVAGVPLLGDARETPAPSVPTNEAQRTKVARAATSKGGAEKSKERALIASTSRPIQVFFVLDDQSVAQSESDAAKAPVAAEAQPAPESQLSKRLHRHPVMAHRPIPHRPSPAEKAD